MKFPEFKKAFVNKRTDKKDLIQRMKPSLFDINSLEKFINTFEKELKPFRILLHNTILGNNSLPKSLDSLAKGNDQYMANNILQELNWQLISFIKCEKEINHFIKLKDDFEKKLILSYYDEARIILDKIESEICVSYWSIENRFILNEYQFGSEKNWEFRNTILDDKTDPIVQTFGDIFSIKTEKNVSFYQFNDELNLWFYKQGINSSSNYKGLTEFFRFKSNYFSVDNYNQYVYLMYKEGGSSIIDRYLMFTRIIQHLFISNPENLEDLILLLRKLRLHIYDNSIENILFVFDEELENFEISSIEIDIIDDYTKGDYKSSYTKSKDYLLNNNSNCIELYEIYCKSLIESGKDYESITENDSIANQISKSFYEILNKKELTDDALVDAVKLSYVFNNSHIGLHLYSFVSNELGWVNEIDYLFLALLNSKFKNPRIINKIIYSKNIPTCFIERFEKKHFESITFQTFKEFLNIENIENENFKSIPKLKSELYLIRNLISNNEFEKCISLYNKIINYENLSIISNYEVVSNLYDCFLKSHLYRNCVEFFVDVYLQNSNLTKKMNYNELLEKIISGKYKNIGEKKELIELPIFFKINCNDKIKIKQTYELFLKSNECNKPTELIKFHENFSIEKLIYFLKNVCVTEIMQLSKSFESTYEVNEERIDICKFLCKIDEVNIHSYKTEIADLTQKNTISKVIGGIDERKIFVNESKLRQTLQKGQKQNFLQNEQVSPLNSESFERYVNLLNYVKKNNEYKDISSKIHFGNNGEVNYIETANNGNILIKEEYDIVLYLPAFRIFSTFFLYIRDMFVFNKEYGLDAYLSTRIRHGTLPNHLRSVFETYSLVTSQTDNIYSDNVFWKEKINISDENLTKLQESLSNFSKEIDDFSRKIKDNYIQCQTEKRISDNISLLNFSYTEQELIWLFLENFNETQELNEFIDKSFIELWKKTESCLEEIREKINGEYRDKYIELIDNLNANILVLDEKHSLNELLNNLMTCRTEIQTKLNNISKWFRRSESSFEGEYKLQVLADTSIEITKNIHPNYLFSIETNICDERTVKGEYHQHFIDLINNCLFNIIKHSQIESENLNAKLKISEINDKLELTFENSVNNSNNHKEKLSTIKDNWQLLDTNINQEGGTGFPKIKKIIFSDMNRKSSYFDFNFDENHLVIKLSFETKDL